MSRLRKILEENPLKWYEHLWIGWPLVLVVAGGLLGGACAGVAWALNRRVFSKIHQPVMRYLITGMISVSALVCYLLLAAAFVTVVGDGKGDPTHDVAAAGAGGFESVPLPDGVSSQGVVVFAPANCSSDAARRTDELVQYLARHGIPYARTDTANYSRLASQEEVSRVQSVMNGPVPVVYVRGKAKANPSPEEVRVEYLGSGAG